MRIIKKIIIMPIVVLFKIIEWFLSLTIKVSASVCSLLLIILVACVIHSIIMQRWSNLFIAIGVGICILVGMFVAVAVDETIKIFVLLSSLFKRVVVIFLEVVLIFSCLIIDSSILVKSISYSLLINLAHTSKSS